MARLPRRPGLSPAFARCGTRRRFSPTPGTSATPNCCARPAGRCGTCACRESPEFALPRQRVGYTVARREIGRLLHSLCVRAEEAQGFPDERLGSQWRLTRPGPEGPRLRPAFVAR